MKYLIDKGTVNGSEIARDLNIEFDTVFTACKEMKADEAVLYSLTSGYGDTPLNIGVIIGPVGRYRVKNNKSYLKEERKQLWIDFPKSKWWLMDPLKFLLGIAVGSIATIAIKEMLKPPKHPFENKTQQKQVTDSSTILHKTH